MDTETIHNLLKPISHDAFIELAKKRAIPNHCELTTSFETFTSWIDNDQSEFLVELFVASGLDSSYNVLNYPPLKEGMETLCTIRLNALGDFYDYYLALTSMHNNKLTAEHASALPTPQPQVDDEARRLAEEGWGMIRAGINAVFNNGPKTYKGKKIQGLYLPEEDEFLQAHPELVPLQEVKAVTIGEWWTGEYDEGSRESTGELMMDTVGTAPEGYEFTVRYMGHGRFHIIDTYLYQGLLFPKALGDILDHDKISLDDQLEYLKHFRLV